MTVVVDVLMSTGASWSRFAAQDIHFGLAAFAEVVIGSADGGPAFRRIIEVEAAVGFDNPLIPKKDFAVVQLFGTRPFHFDTMVLGKISLQGLKARIRVIKVFAEGRTGL